MRPRRRTGPRGWRRTADSGDALVTARGLVKHFPLQAGLARLFSRARRVVRAVDGVDLAVRRGETYGLVGESGSGKTTLGRLLLRLIEPTSGVVTFDGEDITRARERTLRPMRRRMQLVFQDPHASLNPAMTVGEAVAHPLRVHGIATGDDALDRARRLLDEVGLRPADRFLDAFPADLSGGQKQRVVIARAIATEPDFIVADEPVSMLDMSVRAKILELLLDLKRRRDLTLVFVTHDLATAKFLCDRVAIMYLGRIVEEAPAADVFARPLMPYTEALLAAIPKPDPRARHAATPVAGEVPDASDPPAGCRFHPRCPVATGRCGFGPRDLTDAAADDFGAAWRADGRTLRAPAADAARLAELLAARPALAAAVEDRRETAGIVQLTFREPREIRERHVGARRVACLLHADGTIPAGEP